MKLWKVECTGSVGYDEYDSAVIAAETEADALAVAPGPYSKWRGPVKATHIGEAKDGTELGVIVASFNAG